MPKVGKTAELSLFLIKSIVPRETNMAGPAKCNGWLGVSL